MNQPTRSTRRRLGAGAIFLCLSAQASEAAFTSSSFSSDVRLSKGVPRLSKHCSHHDSSSSTGPLFAHADTNNEESEAPRKGFSPKSVGKFLSGVALSGLLTASLAFGGGPAWAENELSDRYGGGLDTSLVDQTCLVDKCSIQAKACLADDPSCRKGLTCTAKCLGDNACITGCMARYGNENLDNLLKCTIEDHECIKVAILPGGADEFGTEPRAPAPTIRNFDLKSMEGSWYKVVGYNPNYDCYACQRNTFSAPEGSDGNPLKADNRLQMDVQFSMPHMLPDGSPLPPKGGRESLAFSGKGDLLGSTPIGLNDYATHEVMVFDKVATPLNTLVMNKGTSDEVSYSRTAHSEGEMFGLKFWENWYIIGENDQDMPEFKFVYYNGKTRQNTYEGAFIYSRTKDLAPESMKKVYQIAKDAGMDPNHFCKIQNGCFKEEDLSRSVRESESDIPFRGILASTKVSEFFGVRPVAAQDTIRKNSLPTAEVLMPVKEDPVKRAWWYEVGDYLENPHRHFQVMDELRVDMKWPEDVVSQK